MNTEKQSLEMLQSRLETLHESVYSLKTDIAKAIEETNKVKEKPLFELSPEIIELITHTFNEFIDERIIGQLDTNHTAYASGDGFQISIDFDLQECVTDALPSTYRLANDFIDDLKTELTSKQEAYEYEQSQITVARIIEHEDKQESENN
jgi:hypothetical protein